jgi:hypothetical protein
MATDPKVGGNHWRRHKAALLRGFVDCIRDVVECETEVERALIAMKLAHMQTEFVWLCDLFEREARKGER